MNERKAMTNTIEQVSDLVMTRNEYAARLKVSPRTVDNLIAEGLPHFKRGSRLVRIPIADADRWVRDNMMTTRTGAAEDGNPRNSRN